ncbi:MAG TPA: hypothetical protein VHI98_07430 [Vicinamibacterales bacterium]|nr:hypothetical protein [Vicinamibacterales bacterium]
MARPKQIGSNVLATPQQITDRFFVFRRDVDRGEAPARYKTASCRASRRSVLIRSPERRGINDGARISHGMPAVVRKRCKLNPQDPAS